ncbi:MAG: CpsD/CapB family tyrosine-protein kinase [Clostridium sp.]|nr:CpsD/CapB family tyrosine-protein kinase [Clostridium sp.]
MFIVEDEPKSVEAESYRTLRTNIQYSSLDKKLQTIVITSSEPGEGKTTTACNLALSFAQADKKTLLIDCDLRKPTIHKQFKISNLIGLSDVLVGKEEVNNILVKYNENLDVLSSGHISPNPSEMINSNVMSNLLNKLKETYEMIIIDSAPLLAVTDAQLLSVKGDGTILVVKAEKTKKDSIIAAKSLLEKVNANILGIVLNQVDRTTKKYYYYYGEDGEKKKKKKRSSK